MGGGAVENEFERNDTADNVKSETASGDAFKELLANPELIARVGAVLGAMRGTEGSGEGNAHAASNGENLAQASSAVPTADGIAALLQNQTLLAQLPQMLAVIKPLMESGAIKPPPSDTAVSAKPSSVPPREGSTRPKTETLFRTVSRPV